MKTINALENVKKFSNTVDKMNTSLRMANEEGIEQLQSAKDYFVNMERFKIPLSLETLGESFSKESKVAMKGKEEIPEMLKTWGEYSFAMSSCIKDVLPIFDDCKTFIDNLIPYYQGAPKDKFFFEAEKAIPQMISLIKNDLENFSCLKKAVKYFETYILPKMSKEERMPEIEEPNLN